MPNAWTGTMFGCTSRADLQLEAPDSSLVLQRVPGQDLSQSGAEMLSEYLKTVTTVSPTSEMLRRASTGVCILLPKRGIP